MVAKKKTAKAKMATPKPKATPKAASTGLSQEMMIGGIVVIVVILLLAFMVFQDQILGTATGDTNEPGTTTNCQDEVYYETATSTVTHEKTIPYEYNILDDAGWVEQGYPSFGTIAKYSYTIENKEKENGTFTLNCSIKTTEDGTVSKSESELILASNPTAIVVEFTISPGEGTELPGCTVSPPNKTETVTEEVTEQIRKTRKPAGC